jgi:Uma2 family endonuclease
MHPRPLTDDEFFDFCQTVPLLRIERNARGEIVIEPHIGNETSYRRTDLAAQLGNWARRDGRGKVFGDVGFLLPDGSVLSPGPAWVDDAKFRSLSKAALQKFAPVVPDFVIEVLALGDNLAAIQAKMERWIANGAALAWLVDADNRTVYVYRPGQPCAVHSKIAQLEAGGPVQGFIADLSDVWTGL